jgi:hypothetical protein
MIERRTYVLLLTALALCALAIPRLASAQTPKPSTIKIRVDSVIATNTGKGMDPQLASSPIGGRLREMFEYTTYRLVMHQERQTVCGRKVTFEMPGGRILHIAPRAVVGNMVSMELVLFEGTRPLMTTDLRLINHALLIVGGPHYQQGMLITIISTDAPNQPIDRGAPPQAMPPPPPSGLPDAEAIPADNSSPPQQEQ